jgi:hypothetical protein
MDRSDRKIVWVLSIVIGLIVWVILVSNCSDPLFRFFHVYRLESGGGPPSGRALAWLLAWLFFAAVLAALITWGLIGGSIKLGRLPEKRRMAMEEEHRRVKAQADRRTATQAALAAAQAAQQRLASQLDRLMSQSVASARELPKLITDAENSLDLAEYEFAEGAFVPFWDAIEVAAKKLATVEGTIQQLIHNSQSYQKDAPGLETPPPQFQIGLKTLPDASHTASRMRAIVRRAQKDADFTKIYLMCRHNELLVAGFSTLGQVLSEISDRLDSSFDRLASSINVSISGLASEITTSQKEMTTTIAGKIDRSTERSASDAEADRKLTRTEIEMLDNIQRRRKPPLPEFGDGEY